MAGFGAARGAAIAAALALAVACGGTTVETSTRGDQSTGGPRATQAASAERSAAPSADAGPPAALARWAFDVARQSADDPGADLPAEAVATTRHAALAAADGGWVDQDGKVWAFVWSGHFHSTGPRPAGAVAPTGTQLFVLMDIASGSLTDLVISNVRPNLESLGTVLHVPPS